MSNASKDPSDHDLTVYVAGHTGLVGSAVLRRMSGRGVRVLTATRAEVDLQDARMVRGFLERERPEVVILAAGTVGGILANVNRPAEFIYHNLMIEANLIHGAWQAGVKRLLNFGSSCMYPRVCPQPMAVDRLMTGAVEPTSEPYAVAKWAGMTLCASYRRQYGADFITAIPCTVYGPGDSFDPDTSHVMAALMRKFHDAKTHQAREVTLWGSGEVKREFIYADDLAEACELLIARYHDAAPINVGSGEAKTVRELAELVKNTVGFDGGIRWDASQPDGAPEKRLDSRPLERLGWSARTGLQQGLEHTYQWFLEHHAGAKHQRSPCVCS